MDPFRAERRIYKENLRSARGYCVIRCRPSTWFRRIPCTCSSLACASTCPDTTFRARTGRQATDDTIFGWSPVPLIPPDFHLSRPKNLPLITLEFKFLAKDECPDDDAALQTALERKAQEALDQIEAKGYDAPCRSMRRDGCAGASPSDAGTASPWRNTWIDRLIRALPAYPIRRTYRYRYSLVSDFNHTVRSD